jgi:hypothetical protein
MKRTIVIVAVLAAMLMLSGFAFAQKSPIDKGSMLLSGGISFASYGGDYYKGISDKSMTQFTINPSASYFVMKGLAVGPTVEFTSLSQGDAKASTFGIGAQATYYFDMLAKDKEGKGALYPYLGAAFLYRSNTSNSGETDEEDTKINSTRIEFKGGAVYMVSNAVGIYGDVEFDMDSYKRTKPTEWPKSVSGNIFGVFTGFTYFIF